MERIKRFFWDESATAEATSTVVMIAAAGVLLAGAFVAWYGGLTNVLTCYSTQLGTAVFDMAFGS